VSKHGYGTREEGRDAAERRVLKLSQNHIKRVKKTWGGKSYNRIQPNREEDQKALTGKKIVIKVKDKVKEFPAS